MIKKAIIGLLAGLICGLFSTGGGMIVVPAIIHLFKIDDEKARATSIFAILPMVIASSIFYLKNDYIDWNISIKCAAGGMLGGFLGVKLLKKIPQEMLRLSFTIFLVYVSIKMVITSL